MEELLGYRYIKLSNTEDILCQVVLGVETENHILVRFPMKVVTMIQPDSDEAYFAFMPFIPFTDSEVIPIKNSSIVTITGIRDDIRDLYVNKVAQYLARLEQRKHSRTVGPDLSDMDESEEIDFDDEEDLLPINKKKTWIH